MPFLSFRKKRKPERAVEFFGADVDSHLTDALRVGESAEHVIDVDNFERTPRQFEVKAGSNGPLLVYGGDPVWHHHFECAGRERIERVGVKRVEIDPTAGTERFPSSEQIKVEIRATPLVASPKVDAKYAIHTLQLSGE